VSLHSREIDRVWVKLGMEIKQSKDVLALFFHDGQFILRTKRSHGSGAIEGKIPHFIRQQMHLSEAQFKDLIDCPLDRAKYIKILTEKGLIQAPKPQPTPPS
jgi:hypothetical protein